MQVQVDVNLISTQLAGHSVEVAGPLLRIALYVLQG